MLLLAKKKVLKITFPTEIILSKMTSEKETSKQIQTEEQREMPRHLDVEQHFAEN